MNTPLISIIIPTYNRAHLIGETLDSVLEQTYTNWECIVVDDGSTDNTDELLAKYCKKDTRFQHHHRPIDRLPGGNAARNYGFEVSKGDYIQWFDDDDLMLKDFIKSKVLAFTDNIDMVIVEGYYLFISKIKEQFSVNPSSFLYKDYVLWKTSIFTPSLIFRKRFLNTNAFLFDEEITKGQESEFFARIFYSLKENQYTIIHQPLFFYRRHSETKSAAAERYNHSFILSSLKNHHHNFSRAIEMKDKELTIYFYKKMLKLLISTINQNDFKMKRNILNTLSCILKKKNNYLLLKIKGFCFFLIYNRKLAAKLLPHLNYHPIKL